MKKLLEIHENDALFEEIWDLVNIDKDISNWDFDNDEQYNYSFARPLIHKKTSRHVGWLVYGEWENSRGYFRSETYVIIQGDVLEDW